MPRQLTTGTVENVPVLFGDRFARSSSCAKSVHSHLNPSLYQTSSKGWRLTADAESMTDPRLFYCLVDLGQDGRLEPPELYIVPSSLIAHHTRMGHAEWLKGVRPDGQPRKDSPIRQILDPVPKSVGDAVRAEFPNGWLERYKENWDILATDASIHRST